MFMYETDCFARIGSNLLQT